MEENINKTGKSAKIVHNFLDKGKYQFLVKNVVLIYFSFSFIFDSNFVHI